MSEIAYTAKAESLLGRRFGRWLVVSYGGPGERYRHMWSCRCDCGTERCVTRWRLVTGTSRSCGCLSRELSKQRESRHGETSRHGATRIYASWKGMKDRCYRKTTREYKRYGGRGIRVCLRWHTFENFLADMGRPPAGHSIDRIDGDGNYEPGNCRWATPKQQARNRRNNVLVTFNNKTQCVAAWAEELGLKLSTLKTRLKKRWPLETALAAPADAKGGEDAKV